MNTGERPIANSFNELPSLMQETYKLCKSYINNNDVLDIGCGEGIVDLYISDAARHVTCIDIDKSVIDEAIRKIPLNNMSFYKMSGEDLLFQSESFDIVISSQSIEHTRDDQKFLNEVYRVLKDDGIFICATPNKLATVPPGEKIYSAPYYPFHYREYTPSQFYNLLDKYFVEVERKCFYYPNPNIKLITSKRVKYLYRLSRFKVVRLLGRILPLSVKERIIYLGDKELKQPDIGICLCDYSDNLSFIPEILCAICRKVPR